MVEMNDINFFVFELVSYAISWSLAKYTYNTFFKLLSSTRPFLKFISFFNDTHLLKILSMNIKKFNTIYTKELLIYNLFN